MIESIDLIKKYNPLFSEFSNKPQILYAISGDRPIEQIDLDIQKDFEPYTKENLPRDKASMMITDGCTIAEDAFFYFLPTLLQYADKDEVNDVLLELTIISIATESDLTSEQLRCLMEICAYLRKMYEEREAKDAWDGKTGPLYTASEIKDEIQGRYSKKAKDSEGHFLLNPINSIYCIKRFICSGLIVLSVKGFFIGENDSVEPVQEHSNDVSCISGDYFDFAMETIGFIQERQNIPDLWFEILVKTDLEQKSRFSSA